MKHNTNTKGFVTNSSNILPLLAGLFVVGAGVASSLGFAVMDEVAVWELGHQQPGYKSQSCDSSRNKHSIGNIHVTAR